VRARLRQFFVSGLCLLATAGAARAAPRIELAPEGPRPGEVILITLRPEQALLRASCSWRGRAYAFLPVEGGYGLVLPVAASARPGGYHATIYWKYEDGQGGAVSLPVEVAPRRFGVQRLRLSASQERRYSAPETAREYQLIGAALDRVGPQRLWRGDFTMPLHGRVSTEFGLQRYVNGRFDYRHRGLDIAAPQGTPVLAPAAGVVALADASFLLHGQTVILDHGQGTASLYLHLSQIEVTPGEAVEQGQVIGRVGATGIATGPHLHYAVYVYHEAVDPRCWLHLPR